MSRRAKTAVALLLVLSMSGCFTIMEWSVKDGPVPYGGVRMWFGDRGTGYQAMLWITVILPLIDIPLCVVADTLLLPVTVPLSVTRDPPADAPAKRPVARTKRPPRPSLRQGRFGELSRRGWRSPRRGALPEGIYRRMRIEPGDGSVQGAGVDRCVIDGDLVIVGSGITVTGVRVLGKVQVIWGGDIDLRGCVIEGHVERLGRGAVQVPAGVEVRPWPKKSD